MIWSKEFYQFQQTFLLNWKVSRIGPFKFMYRKYTYEAVPIYWLILTLDSCPWKINQYFLLELHPILYYIISYPPKKESYSGTEQMMSSQEHFHSYIIYKKMVDVRLHSGSCPSSRTLLSTTSFQTKFYHNIPLVWSRYVIDSIMEPWIVIVLVGT